MHDTVFFDVDTQNDFLLPAGSLYVPGAEKIISRLGRLYQIAKARGIPVIASADAHGEQDPEFRNWPPHCIAGTLGQRKVPETLLAGAVVIPHQGGDLPAGWQSAPQVIVEKQSVDVFQTSTIEAVLNGWPARRYVVFGVVTEICVKNAAWGLLRSGRQVALASEAMASLDSGAGGQALEELIRAGARRVTTPELE